VSQPESLQALLNAVATGQTSPEDALADLKYLTYEPIGNFAKIDHHRTLRTGFPEVIWGPGKTPDQIVEIILGMRSKNPCVMATRIRPEVYAQLQTRLPDLVYFESAQICATTPLPDQPKHPGTIGLLSAGTADLAVAEEAAITASLLGFSVTRFWDVGVAGIHRLLSAREAISQPQVLIVVAGMEGALPSVVAGLVDAPVIAVPTSIGYGANFQGLSALLTMLNSCAPGIGVVNIDNGFGAAMLAAQILRAAAKLVVAQPVRAEPLD
jgi:pyridinium-3,5-biscarboxylic acid mononucleotide synthase